ncbi:transposase [Klebsiella quasipneumoniae]
MELVRLALEKEGSVAALARQHDVNDNLLFKWIRRKRTARTVLTGMCYSVGSVMRQGSSSLTRLTGQSAMTSRTWRR